jgi:hypothetical protein
MICSELLVTSSKVRWRTQPGPSSPSTQIAIPSLFCILRCNLCKMKSDSESMAKKEASSDASAPSFHSSLASHSSFGIVICDYLILSTYFPQDDRPWLVHKVSNASAVSCSMMDSKSGSVFFDTQCMHIQNRSWHGLEST